MHHVSHQGQQFGPYTVEQINQYLAQGLLGANSHVWDANANGWIEIWQLPGVILPSQAVPVAPHIQPRPLITGQPIPAQPGIPQTGGATAAGNIPPASHEISEDHIWKFLAMLPQNSKPVLSCKLARDIEWLVIMIPLWFNIVWTYLIITDTCLAVGTRTLWSGCKEATYFDYDSISAILFYEKKNLIGRSYTVTFTVIGAEEPVEIKIDKNTYQFLAKNVSLIQQVHSNTRAFSEQ